MTVASSMLKGFFGSGETRSGTVIQKAASGELPTTPTVPAATIDTSNVDMPAVPEMDAEDILDTSKPVNRERTSSESFDNRNYNLTNVTDSDELVAIIDNVGRANDNFKNARGGGPQPHKDVVKKAKKADIAELEKIIGYRLGDGVLLKEYMVEDNYYKSLLITLKQWQIKYCLVTQMTLLNFNLDKLYLHTLEYNKQ